MKKNLLLLCFSLLLVFAFIEIALRICNVEKARPADAPKTDWALVPERIWTEHHPVLGWAHQKNKTAVLKIDHGVTQIHTNSLGFRGKQEYSEVKAADNIRIISLGDSFVFGWGVQDDKTFSSRLEAVNDRLEVINLGVPGYGIDQIYLSYKIQAKKLRPDIALIGIFPEDFWRATRSFADTGHAKPYFVLSKTGQLIHQNQPVPPPFSLVTHQFPIVVEPGAFETLLLHSLTYRFVKRKVLKLGKTMRLVDPETSEEWILGRAILRALIQELREDQVRPVLLIMPSEAWVLRRKPDSLHRSIMRFSKREGVDVIDLLPAFTAKVAESKIDDYFIPMDRHWTDKGHELASQEIHKFLTAKHYVR